MRALSQNRLNCLGFIFFFFISLTFASTDRQRYSVGFLPVASTGKPTQIGVIVGTPVTQNSPAQPDKVVTRLIWSIDSYTAPRKEAEAWARIGLLDATGKAFNGSTSLASMAALKDPGSHAAELYLQLDANSLPESVSLRGTRESHSASAEKGASQPKLLVMTSAPEPRPVLNRPVVLNAEGKVEEAPKEKTLLQK
jgi:hypothetical protein